MKPIINLYSDKVTITDKRELLPLAKSDAFVVAGNKNGGVMYSNVSKEVLEREIQKRMLVQPELMFLQIAMALTKDFKVVFDLDIIDGKVSMPETTEARVLMANSSKNIIIAELDHKFYTNDKEVALQCIQHDIEEGIPSGIMLKMLIDTNGGLIECEMKVW